MANQVNKTKLMIGEVQSNASQVTTENLPLYSTMWHGMVLRIRIHFGSYFLTDLQIRSLIALDEHKRELIINKANDMVYYLHRFQKPFEYLLTLERHQLERLSTVAEITYKTWGMLEEELINHILDTDSCILNDAYKFYAQYIDKISSMPLEVKRFIIKYVELFLHVRKEEMDNILDCETLDELFPLLYVHGKEGHPAVIAKMIFIPEVRDIYRTLDRMCWINLAVAKILHSLGLNALAKLSFLELTKVVSELGKEDSKLIVDLIKEPTLREILVSGSIKTILEKNPEVAYVFIESDPKILNKLSKSNLLEILYYTAKDHPEISIQYLTTHGVDLIKCPDENVSYIFSANPEVEMQVKKLSDPLKKLYSEFHETDDKALLKLITENKQAWEVFLQYPVCFPFYVRRESASSNLVRMRTIYDYRDDFCVATLTHFKNRVISLLIQLSPAIAIDFYNRGLEFLNKLSKKIIFSMVVATVKSNPEIAASILATTKLVPLGYLIEIHELSNLLRDHADVVKILVEQSPDYFLNFDIHFMQHFCPNLALENRDLAEQILSLPKLQEKFPNLLSECRASSTWKYGKKTPVLSTSQTVLFSPPQNVVNDNSNTVTIKSDEPAQSNRERKNKLKKKHHKRKH